MRLSSPCVAEIIIYIGLHYASAYVWKKIHAPVKPLCRRHHDVYQAS
ncbi:hypothetical protein CI610_03765 [invertebrate metagenome]|uniref:Uncharacterized protein n=1 Tax=invertebrate metagenome TaxID=1711999 RepID=A0A2H9T282_9ZZZZ